MNTQPQTGVPMKDPSEFAVTIRLATDAELESVGATDHANTTDGAALVLLGGEIIAVTNEYGTAMISKEVTIYDPDGEKMDLAEQVERLAELATNLWTPEAVHGA